MRLIRDGEPAEDGRLDFHTAPETRLIRNGLLHFQSHSS